MARKILTVESDFLSVMNRLRSQGDLAVSFNAQWLGHYRSIHKLSFSLIWWKFRIQAKSVHRKVYVSEMASDALQILPMVSVGYFKAACLLCRGVIENCLRHIYFSDHPVEFQRLNMEKEWYVSVRQLFDYLAEHPQLSHLRDSYDAYADLKSTYSDLSTVVHGTKLQHMQLHAGLMQIKPSINQAKLIEQHLKKVSQAVNFLFVAYHTTVFRRRTLDDREIILSVLPSSAKNAISRLP